MASKAPLLSYRTCQPMTEVQASVIQAAAAFNQGRSWVLRVVHDEWDRHVNAMMVETETADDQGNGKWPGAYEAQALLDGLADISRTCKVDWEILNRYGLRPVGYLRQGVCIRDKEAEREATMNLGTSFDK